MRYGPLESESCRSIFVTSQLRMGPHHLVQFKCIKKSNKLYALSGDDLLSSQLSTLPNIPVKRSVRTNGSK